MADNIQTKSEAALVKKVGDIANVLAAFNSTYIYSFFEDG